MFDDQAYNDLNTSSPLNQPETSKEAFLALRKRRNSVSAESYDPRVGSSIAPDFIEKSPEEWARLNSIAEKNLFLRGLDDETRKLVLDAMFEVTVQAEEEIITQGDLGDNFYVIEKGNFEVFVDGVSVVSLHDGQSFGELALMYNQPRAATVTARGDGILWAIDGVTFRKVIIDISYKKRTNYENMLSNVPLFKQLSRTEICRIAEAVVPIKYKPHSIIIHQGDIGEEFFIIAKGKVKVTQHQQQQQQQSSQKGHGHGHEKILKTLGDGDYFGELALLNEDSKRTATVTSLDDEVLCLTLSRADFIRLLGSVIKLMPTKRE